MNIFRSHFKRYSAAICAFISPLLVTANISLAASGHDLMQPAPLDPQAEAKLLRLEGSTTVGNVLAPKMAEKYLTAKGLQNVSTQSSVIGDGQTLFRVSGLSPQGNNHYIEITANGSSNGFKALVADRADIAMASRSIKDKEVTALEKLGNMRDIKSQHIVAIDGLAIITHPENPINKLTINELAAIYSGKVNNWKMFGGPDAPIQALAHEKGSGTQDTFKSLILKKRGKQSENVEIIHSAQEIAQKVATTPNTISYATISMVGDTKQLAISANHDDIPVLPTQFNVAAEEYPISRRLYMYSVNEPTNPLVQEFIAFCKHHSQSNVIASSGFIPQQPIAINPNAPRVGPKEYLNLIEKAEKLSISLKFPAGSVSLNNIMEYDLQRIAAYMTQAQQQGREIMLIGFGDRENQRASNNLLSKLRAKKVKNVLKEHEVTMGPIAGFNAYSDPSAAGNVSLIKKRRVEVWVR